MSEQPLVDIANCAICPGVCRFDCSAGSVLKKETASPSGKMKLALMLGKGYLDESKELYDVFYQCLGCRSCQTWCSFKDMAVPDLLNEYKIRAVDSGLAPQPVYKMQKDLERWQTLFPKEQMTVFAAEKLDNPDVLLFAGCAYRSMKPAAINAALELLKSAGVKVAILEDETCCGFPASCWGLRDTNLKLAEMTRDKIKQSGANTVVTLCPECLDSFTRRYHDAGIDMDMEVIHLVQFVERLVEEKKLAFDGLDLKTCYHDPCTLGRKAGIFKEPRHLLGMALEKEIMEAVYNREKAHCCGAGQLFEYIQPEAARALAQRRVKELEKGGAEAIVTACAFCEDMLGRVTGLPVYDVAEILWASSTSGPGRDWLLQKKMDSALARDELLKSCNIKTSVTDGIITLRGQAEDWDQVVKAGHLAGSLPGVYSVVNRLSVPGLEPVKLEKTPAENSEVMHPAADVVIIGAGVVGCGIARELSRYDLKIVLIEKEADFCCGTSTANNGMIHPGIFVEPGTLKARLNIRGVELYPALAQELDFPFDQCGLLGVVDEPKEMFLLDLIKAAADYNGVPGVEVMKTAEGVLAHEPNLPKQPIGGFFAPTCAITSPYKVTIAYAENAVQNGVDIHLNTTVTGMEIKNGQLVEVITDHGRFPTRYTINAAGLYADEVADMTGQPEFTIHPRKGELLLLDRKMNKHFSSCAAEVTTKIDPNTKGGGIMLTVDGNIEMGPTAEEVPDKDNLSCSVTGLERIKDKFGGFLPVLKRDDIIAYFAGLRAATYTEDFHIRPSRFVKGLINVAGIQSPGLAAAPAIAEYVLGLLREEGLELNPRPDFNPIRKEKTHFKDLNNAGRQALIESDRRYGNVVCRCELVTEGDIVEALHREVPVTTLDGVKRRTRAGMGRCQGGFCTPKVAAIMAREMGVGVEEITKDGTGSWLFVPRNGREAI
ncbi:MAG: FAD-dependent oxidoreductase [Chitinophagales bacterium]